MNDLRFAFRQLRQSPRSRAVATLTFAPSVPRRAAVASARQTQPASGRCFDVGHGRRRKSPQPTQKLGRRHGQHALDVESAGFEKTGGNRNLRETHGALPPGPSAQRLPRPLKLDPPRSRGRKHRRRACQACVFRVRPRCLRTNERQRADQAGHTLPPRMNADGHGSAPRRTNAESVLVRVRL